MTIIRKKLFIFRCGNIGTVTYKMLLKNFGIDGAIEYISQVLKENYKYKISSWEDIDKEITNLKNFGGRFITEEDNEFPKNNDDLPPILSIIGNIELLKKKSVTVIGTRNPSLNGLQYTKYLCRKWREKDLVIISGMALGIDTIAHEENTSNTIAVLPGGIDIIYPKQNYFLYNDIKNNGLLISSCPFGENVTNRNFPRRNRILAALGNAIVVTEAMKNSGALITTNYGKKYNKKIFSVPGHPLDMRYEGNNILLKNGGYLMDDPQILVDKIFSLSMQEEEEIPLISSINNIFNKNISLKDKEILKKKIFNFLSILPVSINSIIEYTKYPIGDVNYVLTEMEILGEIERYFDNSVSLIIKL
ncbi:hypothetical protein AB836_00835 [Rickettsiales bacterium (ex Bugula neritina AB1)]|nr:hypothetical protein AB836_00835 [Rickettsiales bacterium (ex Bugula neritina AB1)]